MIIFVIEGVIVLVVALLSWYVWDRRYRGSQGANFIPTDEVSVDPRTGERTRVYHDPATGRREYRRES